MAAGKYLSGRDQKRIKLHRPVKAVFETAGYRNVNSFVADFYEAEDFSAHASKAPGDGPARG